MKLLDINQPMPSTDEEAKQYLPDNPSAYGIYDIKREQGLSIIDALVYTLEKCIQAQSA